MTIYNEIDQYATAWLRELIDAGDDGCPQCNDDGGEWHCTSSPEWCQKNPLLGRGGTSRGNSGEYDND